MRFSKVISSRFLMLLICGLLLGGTTWATTIDLLNDCGVAGCFLDSADTQPQALFKVSDKDLSSGSGVIHSIVRIHSSDTFEEGFNTDYRPPPYDENSSSTFTRDLQLSMVPWFDTISGDNFYLEFLLDINQTGNNDTSKVSLVSLEIYLSNEQDLETLDGADPFWELKNDYIVDITPTNMGSGEGDLLVYIPVGYDDFFDYTYVNLYSKFGVDPDDSSTVGAYAPASGFEEWAVILYKTGGGTIDDPVDPPDPPDDPPSTVPEPGSLILLGSGLAGLGLAARRRIKK